jgi:hypothetical protein
VLDVLDPAAFRGRYERQLLRSGIHFPTTIRGHPCSDNRLVAKADDRGPRLSCATISRHDASGCRQPSPTNNGACRRAGANHTAGWKQTRRGDAVPICRFRAGAGGDSAETI